MNTTNTVAAVKPSLATSSLAQHLLAEKVRSDKLVQDLTAAVQAAQLVPTAEALEKIIQRAVDRGVSSALIKFAFVAIVLVFSIAMISNFLMTKQPHS